MNDFKKGDRVRIIAAGTVETISNPTGRHRITMDNGEVWGVPTEMVTPIDPDELKVGDRVKIVWGGQHKTITQVITGYRFEDSPKFAIYASDEFTKLPPKPTYTLDRHDDILFVMGAGNEAARSVPLDDGAHVEDTIVRWATKLGIDADKARELVAEERVLKPLTVGVFTFTATRQDCLWVARVSLPTRGVSHALAEAEAKRLFPTVTGPYWNEQ